MKRFLNHLIESLKTSAQKPARRSSLQVENLEGRAFMSASPLLSAGLKPAHECSTPPPRRARRERST